MADEKELSIVIRAKDEATKIIKSTTESMNKHFKDTQIMMGTVGAAMTAAGVAVGYFGVTATKAYIEAEASQKRFETSLKNIAKASDDEISALRSQQMALQRTTRFEDDAIASAQGFLGTFQLSAKQIEFMTPRLLDMAEGLRDSTGATMGLEQASNMLGKAIQLGTVGMLAKAGVTIPGTTSAMQELWKKNFELANIQERVKMVGELVDGNFKGQAQSAGITLAGALDRLKNSYGNMLENVGQGISLAFGPLLNKIVDIVQKIEDWTANNPQLAATIVTVSAVLLGLGGTLTIFLAVLPQIVAGFQFILSAIMGLFSPIGLLVGIIGVTLTGALVAFGAYAFTHTEDLKRWFKETYERLIEWFNRVKEAWQDPVVKIAMDSLKEAVKNLGDAVAILFSTLSGAPKSKEDLKNMTPEERQKQMVEDMATAVFFLADAFNSLAKAIEWIATTYNKLREGLDIIKEWNRETPTWKKALEGVLGGPFGIVMGWFKQAGKVPGFQMGGVVYETGLALVHQGERVVPQGYNYTYNQKYNQPVININLKDNARESDIAWAVSQAEYAKAFI